MQVQPKWFLRSKEIWGGLIAAAAAVAPVVSVLTGIDVSAEDVREVGEAAETGASYIWQGIAGMVGLAMVVWGRFTRKVEPVSVVPNAPLVTVSVPLKK